MKRTIAILATSVAVGALCLVTDVPAMAQRQLSFWRHPGGGFHGFAGHGPIHMGHAFSPHGFSGHALRTHGFASHGIHGNHFAGHNFAHNHLTDHGLANAHHALEAHNRLNGLKENLGLVPL